MIIMITSSWESFFKQLFGRCSYLIILPSQSPLFQQRVISTSSTQSQPLPRTESGSVKKHVWHMNKMTGVLSSSLIKAHLILPCVPLRTGVLQTRHTRISSAEMGYCPFTLLLFSKKSTKIQSSAAAGVGCGASGSTIVETARISRAAESVLAKYSCLSVQWKF